MEGTAQFGYDGQGVKKVVRSLRVDAEVTSWRMYHGKMISFKNELYNCSQKPSGQVVAVPRSGMEFHIKVNCMIYLAKLMKLQSLKKTENSSTGF
jgi:hypothetical protein